MVPVGGKQSTPSRTGVFSPLPLRGEGLGVRGANDGSNPIGDYELASRISYFLWSSMPDNELLRHAEAGDLQRPDVLLAQTRPFRAR